MKVCINEKCKPPEGKFYITGNFWMNYCPICGQKLWDTATKEADAFIRKKNG